MGKISAVIMFDYKASSGIISLIQLYQILEYGVLECINFEIFFILAFRSLCNSLSLMLNLH